MPVPVRNDSPSGAATTTRALERVAARLGGHAAVRPHVGRLVAEALGHDSCARWDSVPGMENESETFSPDATAKPAAPSTSSHDEHDPAVAETQPKTVQHACHVHSWSTGAGYPTSVGYTSVARCEA